MNISFLFPSFLFALFSVLVPVIIHLFNFRKYKIVYFSDLKLLRNLQNQTRSTSQLKNILILICRILAILFLVLAFSQPFIPDLSSIKFQNQKVVAIYVDNSFSMEGESKYGKMIEVAKKKAREIADAYPSDTKFLLITNDFDPKYQEPVSKNQLTDYLSEITTGPVNRNISEVISYKKDLLSLEKSRNQKNLFYFLSDFQKTTSDFGNVVNDTNQFLRFSPLSTQTTNNLYIDSCWFETPGRKTGQQEELFVKVVNNSNESYKDIPVKLYINDTIKSLSSFNINEDESQVVKLSYQDLYSGIVKGKVEITDYPVIFDNTFFFGYEVLRKLKLLVINDGKENRYLNALFSGDEYTDLQNRKYEGLDYSMFPDFNAIILNELQKFSSGLIQELENYVKNGGVILIIPSNNCETTTYNDFLKNINVSLSEKPDTQTVKLSSINYESGILRDVFKKKENNIDYPSVSYHYIISDHSANGEEILGSDRKDNILSLYQFKNGKVFLFASPLNDKSNSFVKHPIFVPVVYNIVSRSPGENKLYYMIGRDQSVEVINKAEYNDNVFHIISEDKRYDFIPEQRSDFSGLRLFFHDNIRYSGNYRIMYRDSLIKEVSFNYKRNESDLRVFSRNDIQAQLKSHNIFNFSFIDVNDKYLSKNIRESNEGIRLWKYCILLTLFFLGLEILLIRLLR